jgi:hypothetical protein
VVKLELLKSLHYFINLNRSIAMWNRTAVKSSVGSRRCNQAESRLHGEVLPFRHKLAMLSLRDSIHGVARSREVRLLNELCGSHAASMLRWRGSFWGSFVPLNKLLVGSSLSQNLFL